MPPKAYEWWSLAAFETDTADIGMEFRGEHRIGSEFVSGQRAKEDWFAKNPLEFKRVNDYIAAEITRGLLGSINDIGAYHSIDMRTVANWQISQGFGSIRAWVEVLPTADCQYHLEAAKMRNPQWPWQQHDYTDIASISGALPYVDLLVTEKPWAHVIRTSKLDKKYETQIVTNISGLMEILDQL
jgi:hypothetical protein